MNTGFGSGTADRAFPPIHARNFSVPSICFIAQAVLAVLVFPSSIVSVNCTGDGAATNPQKMAAQNFSSLSRFSSSFGWDAAQEGPVFWFDRPINSQKISRLIGFKM